MVTHGILVGGAKRKHHGGGASKIIILLFLDMNADHRAGGCNDIHLNEAQKICTYFFQ